MKHLKKLFSLLLCLALCAGLSVSVFAQDDATWGDIQQDNFIRITTADAWSQGTLENLDVVADVGDGALRLTAGQTEGTYISPELDVPAFEYMVASWGADTPEGTWVEIKARAYVDMKDVWSDWLSWGKYGYSIKRASTDDNDGICKVNTDIFTVMGSNGETSSRIQLMAVLHSDDAAVTPTLRQIATTSKNTLSGQAVTVYHPNAGMELPEKVVLDTPAYSQMIRDPAIGDSICSPTSLTMMLNDRDAGLDLFPEDIALREYDFNYGFGNWAFTVAAAGYYGYNAYCHYADFDFIREELACGRSVALSVRYSSSTGGSNPYLENGAAGDTNGHLICIVGYETIDGVDYFYSNDAAARGDENCVLRRYRQDQLDAAWSNRLCYVMSAEPEQNAGQQAPQVIEGALELDAETGTYRLMVGGEQVVMAAGFNSKTSNLGAGTVFAIPDDAVTAAVGDQVATTANKEMVYLSINSSGNVVISENKVKQLDADAATVYIIVNNGPTYAASVDLPEIVEEPAAPSETPEETPDQSEPQGGLNPAVFVGILAVVAVALAFALTKLRKKNGKK